MESLQQITAEFVEKVLALDISTGLVESLEKLETYQNQFMNQISVTKQTDAAEMTIKPE